jgi:hypothetical protein
MADFSTNMSEWKGGFAPVQGYGKVQRGTDEIVANAAMSLLSGLGKGYAQAQGANILGTSTTAVEAQQTADQFGEMVGDTSGLDEAAIQDMKDQALRKFGTNDKKLQALVNAGHITTLEANARRHAMLQENLSNPILAMFQEDFLNASAPYTGGSGELAKKFFGAYQPTEEERIQLEMEENTRANTVAKLNAIDELKVNYGFTDTQAEEYWDSMNASATELATAERQYKMLQYGSPKAFAASQAVNNLFSTVISGQIVGAIAKGGSLTPEQVTGFKGMIEQHYLQARQSLQKFAQKMTTEDRNKAFADLESERKRYLGMLNDQSQLEALTKASELLKTKSDIITGQAIYEFTKNAPTVAAAYKMAPEFGEFVVGVYAGDYDAKLKRATDPRLKALFDTIEGIDTSRVVGSAFGKVISGGSFNPAEKAVMAVSMQRPGAAAAFSKLAQNSPENAKEMVRQAMSAEGASLSMVADSDEWKMALNTAGGKELISPIFKATASKVRQMQAGFNGKFPKSVKVERVLQAENAAWGMDSYTYLVKTDGTKLDDNVKRELIQMYKVLEANPSILKTLGKGSIDEVISGAFAGDI